jgi:hypothetical protein
MRRFELEAWLRNVEQYKITEAMMVRLTPFPQCQSSSLTCAIASPGPADGNTNHQIPAYEKVFPENHP